MILQSHIGRKWDCWTPYKVSTWLELLKASSSWAQGIITIISLDPSKPSVLGRHVTGNYMELLKTEPNIIMSNIFLI